MKWCLYFLVQLVKRQTAGNNLPHAQTLLCTSAKKSSYKYGKTFLCGCQQFVHKYYGLVWLGLQLWLGLGLEVVLVVIL